MSSIFQLVKHTEYLIHYCTNTHSHFILPNGRYPKLCCRYKESNGAGEDVFRKFSAYIKNPFPAKNNSKAWVGYFQMDLQSFSFIFCHMVEPVTPLCLSVLEKNFLSTLVKLNMYLETPLPQELDQNPNATLSSRLYLDGDAFTLADCNLLPKLNIVKVSLVQQYSVSKNSPSINGTVYLSGKEVLKEL